MADKKKKDMPVQETTNSKYNKRRWFSPKKRSEGYANDLREKVHTYGKKEGKELTDKEACVRIGYLQAQNDNAGMHIFTKALKEGKDIKEARRLSRIKNKKNKGE